MRGIGLLDIRAIFGETAVRRKMRLKLIVHLVRKETMAQTRAMVPRRWSVQTGMQTGVKGLTAPVRGRPMRVREDIREGFRDGRKCAASSPEPLGHTRTQAGYGICPNYRK